MTIRFPKNSAVAALTDRLQQRVGALLRDLEHDLDDVLQEQYRAGYQQGFQEGAHEIYHEAENYRHRHAILTDGGREEEGNGNR